MIDIKANMEQEIFNFDNEINKISMQRDSKLFLYLLNMDKDINLDIDICENAYLELFFINTGKNIAVNANLNEENCNVNIAGIYNLKNKDKCKIDVNINHNKPNSVSRQNIRGIVNDQTFADIKLKTYVDFNSIKTDANQLHKAIVLNDSSKVVARPELEIYNDDVKCSHGNTIGNLDKQAMFYLQARGIDENTAKNMLINGFLDEVVKEVTKNDIKNQIFDIIN